MTLEYFYPERSTKITSKTGFRAACRDCSRTQIYKKQKNIQLNKEGKHLCSRCKKILPLSRKYFAKMKSKYGFNRTCRKCDALRKKIIMKDKEHRKRWLKYFSAWRSQKYRTDPCFKLICNQRNRINAALKSLKKDKKTIEYLDCTPEELKDHLEKKFRKGMSWENHTHNGWHADHIIPCAKFDLRCPLQKVLCFHHSNLQPLWASANQSKGAKILFGDITSPKT
tara:strand:- start:40 stop:714 length:675 start_codon:yes stop_codon:yes gene_type:complete